MTKTCKKLLTSVLLALCLVISAFAIVACGKTPNEAVTYTVTVQTEEAPASGVVVKIRKGGATYSNQTTDADGKVSFELAADEYDVTLENLPAHYVVPATASLKLTAEKPDLTVTLEKSFTYTVKLVDEKGDPFYAEGVMVGICTLDGNCLTPVAIGTDGVAIVDAEAGDYKVQILGLPMNMVYEQDNGYYAGEHFSATLTEMTITIKEIPLATLDFSGAPMTAAEKEAFCADNWSFQYNPAAQEFDTYMLTLELDAGETGYFYITAPLEGKYYVFTDYTMIYAESTFNTDYFSRTFFYKAGQQHTITATNDSDETATATLVMTKPFSSYVALSATTNELALTVGRADAGAIVAYTPAATGKYTMTVLGNTSAAVTVSEYEPDDLLYELPEDGDYKKDASESFLYSKPYLKTTIYFVVTVKADKYPVALSVKLAKTGESVDTTTVVGVTETLAKPVKPEGKELFGVPMTDGTADTLTKSDGKYYYNGKQVYVKITEPLEKSRFSDGLMLAYMDIGGIFNPDYVFTTLTDTGSATLDYRLFIRGFEDYDYEPGIGGNVAKIPETLEEENCYANYVNDDGAYPLTEELEIFLKKFYEFNEFSLAWQLPSNAMDSDSAWLFPCYYYDDEIVADDIVGEYKFLSKVQWGTSMKVGDAKEEWQGGGLVTEDDYKLVVDKYGSYTIYELSWDGEYNQLDSGNWTKDGNTYTFTSSDPMWDDEGNPVDFVFTVTFDSTTGYIKLVGNDATEGDEYSDPQPATEWEFGTAPASEDDTQD